MFVSTYTARLAAVASVVLLAACAPKINNITISDGDPGERLPVTASVTKNQTTIQGVRLDVRRAGETDFNEVDSMTSGGGQYSGQTSRLVPGDYEAQVRVLYKAMFQAQVKTKSRIEPFSLSWPPGTFGFETSGLAGWRYAGVFGASNNFQHCDDDALAVSPNFSMSTAGYPVGINNTGGPFFSNSLRVVVSSNCYPDSDAEVGPTGFWNFNLLSPGLLSNAAWQDISGVSFRVVTNVPFGVQAIPTIVYVDENGDNQVTSPTTGINQLDFTEVPGNQTWVTIDKTWNIPDRPIHSLELRFFGEPESLAGFPGSTVLVDVISPIP